MTATTFNPLAVARNLKTAGIEADHAEAIAEGMREAADAAACAERADLATKADLAELRAVLYREIGTLRSELRWILGFLAALILAIAAKLFGIELWIVPAPSVAVAKAHEPPSAAFRRRVASLHRRPDHEGRPASSPSVQQFPLSPETSIESPQSSAQTVEKAVKSWLHDRVRSVSGNCCPP